MAGQRDDTESLGAWTAMFSGAPQDWASSWQVFSPAALGSHSETDLSRAFAENPVLRSFDSLLNANPLREVVPVDWGEIAHALRVVTLRAMANPAKAFSMAAEFNASVLQSAAQIWSDAARRWFGGPPAAGETKKPGGDKRFAAPEWQDNPAFRMLRDLYLLASDALIEGAGTLGVDAAEQQRIDFHLRQFVDAMSPSLMLFSNPLALRRAIETGGASLADGMRNLLADLKKGKLSMVDATAFAPGRNLAMTPGKVVHRNKLIELIQYAPVTEEVRAVPLLLLPPWINKYYILDLQPKNSMIGYLVAQGFTVFVVSWKNPDAAMEATTIEDYMHLGPLAASDVVRDITGSPTVNVMGYCIGGTLLAMTLAWLAQKGDDRFSAATFIVSLQDFGNVGDSAIFSDESGLHQVERQMLERGYLDSREMSNMFNLLRSNDLIWSNVVNNYLLGQQPPAFDLLYWNSDGTRMARAAHSWYLHNTYSENNLIVPGKVQLDGVALDLGRIKLDVYAIGAEKDHIVPWEGAWRITQLFGGAVRFVLASSGHIAGIINPPGGKGTYWVNEDLPNAENAAQWRTTAVRHDGSWWTDWVRWLDAHSGGRVAAPNVGSNAHPVLADAPGGYVLET